MKIFLIDCIFITKYILGITETKPSMTTDLDTIYSTMNTKTMSTLTTAITRKNVVPSGIATKLNIPNSTGKDENIFWHIKFQICYSLIITTILHFWNSYQVLPTT